MWMLTLAALPPTTVRSRGEKCVVGFAASVVFVVVVALAVVVAVLNPVLNFFQLGIFLICLLYIKNLLLPLLFASASALLTVLIMLLLLGFPLHTIHVHNTLKHTHTRAQNAHVCEFFTCGA